MNLFADDTTVFLNEEDGLEDLEKILDNWCMALTAVFNIAKTQILPIGKKEYRLRIIMDRRASPDQRQIPEHIHIAMEDEAIRTLGAWYGHNLHDGVVWANQLEKIDESLENWNKSNPTMDGRKKIIQMVIGGMSQYLTQVQGMPKSVEKKLKKRIRQFLWAEKKISPSSSLSERKAWTPHIGSSGRPCEPPRRT
ncbi:hypothetical protein BT96DRAFT_961116 [Gymnopus androsaceus JB14]|uniref:Reverse transcriptase domain-containing protein n=1 Tax=Gymnopus androsaceus JB14 TaxID=1447944 RepID=A0A6A4GBS8_9AGAR|nr:hypothetical protein BT96DRAFT_961116 [Gymnopus androsaceus JB14]